MPAHAPARLPRSATALVLAAATLLAGCLGPQTLPPPDDGTTVTGVPSQPPRRLVGCPAGPGMSPAPATLEECRAQFEATRQAGPWTVLVERELVRGARGEVLPFWLLIPSSVAAPLSWIVPAPWVRIQGGNAAVPLTPAGGLFLGEVLAGAVPQAAFTIVPDQATSGQALQVAGPRVEVVGAATPLPTVALRDPALLSPGLWVHVEQQLVTSTYTLGTMRDPLDCGEALRPVGEHTLQRLGATWTLVGFVAREGGAACAPALGDRAPRVVATAGPLAPSPLRAVVYEHGTPAGVATRFPPGGWVEHEVLDNIVGPGLPAALRQLQGCQGRGPEVFAVITDAAVFAERWRAGCGSGPIPAVDFARESVVAAFWGPQPAGSTVRIASVLLGDDHVVVRVERTQPGVSCAAGGPLAFPADLAVTERIEALGRVTFEHADIAPC